MYDKNEYIYIINNSLTSEITLDIVENFEENFKSNIILFSIIDIFIELNISKIKPLNKVTEMLKKELKKNIIRYLEKIKNSSLINKEDNFNQKYSLLNIDFKHLEKISFNIKKYEINGEKKYDIINNNKTITNKKDIKILKYIWFLNDYEGEISFWNNYKIKPKKGMFLLFPISWCFPYEEKIIINSIIYTIEGDIYL
jgi:hypothetical protein